MKNKIGFVTPAQEEKLMSSAHVTVIPREQEAVKSIVQIRFPSKNTTLAYLNDKFDLHCGDMVYVDGKLAGLRGIVTDVTYNFKIKVSQYQKVIAVIDTEVHGKLYLAGSHLVSFNRETLPKSQILTWFRVPDDDDEYVSGDGDDASFYLDDLEEFDISSEIAERGHKYYMQNKVRYISVDGTKGYAIVEGSEGYEVEFRYDNGQISHLICSCFCSHNCKHEFATLLQLRETLDLIEEFYAEEYEQSAYFAAICKGSLFDFAIESKETGSITI